MKHFLLNTAAFLLWSAFLFTVALAPLVLDRAEAVAAIVAATVAAFSIGLLVFWGD